MNIIQELTEKYSGQYSEGLTKKLNSPLGKYIYQPKNGIITVDGSIISITLDETGGAMPVTEPFRMTLHLDKVYDIELSIFPKDLWNKFTDLFVSKQKEFIPKSILQQFQLDGDKSLLKQLVSDKTFIETIINEKIYIQTGKKPTDQIVLTPEYGIKDMQQFEKYVFILKRIEMEIRNGINTVYTSLS